jgi:hypothetical protein
MRKIIPYTLLIVPAFLLILSMQAEKAAMAIGPPATKGSSHDSAAKEDTTLQELHLSSEGVYGVDSSGAEWEYDFSQSRFVKGKGKTEGTRTVFRKSEADMIREADSAKREIYSAIKKIKGLQLGAIEIGPGEKVDGPLVAVGPITVEGLVDGDVISYKKITVTESGEITGDARAPEIVKMRGGIIGGRRYETELPKIPQINIFQETSYSALIVNLVILSVLLFCGFLATAIMPKPISRLHDCMQTRFLKSFLTGFLVWILFAPLFGLLCLTIIGIPIAIFALPIGLVLALILGSVALGQTFGEWISSHFGGPSSTQLPHVIFGLAILYSPWIIMSLLRISPSSVSRGFSIPFLVISIIIWSIGVTAGLGAVVLTRFGSRDCSRAKKISIRLEVVPSPPPPSPPPLKSDEGGG